MYVPVTGNERFEGFAIDMMQALAESRNWTYQYKQVPDNLTGAELPNGSWSGMIGMLMTNVSHLLTPVILPCWS